MSSHNRASNADTVALSLPEICIEGSLEASSAPALFYGHALAGERVFFCGVGISGTIAFDGASPFSDESVIQVPNLKGALSGTEWAHRPVKHTVTAPTEFKFQFTYPTGLKTSTGLKTTESISCRIKTASSSSYSRPHRYQFLFIKGNGNKVYSLLMARYQGFAGSVNICHRFPDSSHSEPVSYQVWSGRDAQHRDTFRPVYRKTVHDPANSYKITTGPDLRGLVWIKDLVASGSGCNQSGGTDQVMVVLDGDSPFPPEGESGRDFLEGIELGLKA